ncbi:MAG: DNA-protecting protein DprA [Candidatus Omnitrophica bacterium]|nr:DNA-protecting protein DprA [Candidatus Omnitrophota bacterium]
MQTRAVQTLTLKDAGYPKLLREIHAPPELLYVKGALLSEDSAAVAMVGTRLATSYGLDTARRLAEELARSGVTVVSGLAEGIDRAAHEGALEAGGRTIAVVGHGLSTIYPAHHRDLAERIARSGCVVSQFPMGMPPLAQNFPQRNEIIAGLSLGVVVVEAPFKSGALITARHAMEQGREVFAVPGPIGRNSEGTHRLLRDGAKLVETAQDILEELAPHLRQIVRSSTGSERTETAQNERVEGERWLADLSEEQQQVLKVVPVGLPVGLDRLAGQTALAPNRLLSVLTELEIRGLVRQGGQGFTRRK